MNIWWIFTAVTVLLAIGLVWWLLQRRQPASAPQTDIQLWDAEDHQQRDFWPELIALQQADSVQVDTQPAVLARQEWEQRHRDAAAS